MAPMSGMSTNAVSREMPASAKKGSHSSLVMMPKAP